MRVGGYGFPISDEGSGADLGLHAIRLALRAGDGRALATSFTREVMVRRTPRSKAGTGNAMGFGYWRP